MIDERALSNLERDYTAGMTSAEILDVFAAHAIPLSEATLRKYVQLGLLPRSIRVGRKGKHQGSQGRYPTYVVRQILNIKEMMATNLTIEQIQREFFFIRNDLQELEVTLARLFKKLDGVMKERKKEPNRAQVHREVGEARHLSKDLILRLEAIEGRLTSRTKLEQATAS